MSQGPSFELAPLSLNVGCGRTVLNGWVNLDVSPLPGVDLVCDLETLRQTPIPLPDNSVEKFLLSHVIEHVRDALGLMQELWRLAAPDATCVIRTPHGASDDSWEDQTHVRPYFTNSFGYFSQPFYWRADYGYLGDCQPETIHMFADKTRCEGFVRGRNLRANSHRAELGKRDGLPVEGSQTAARTSPQSPGFTARGDRPGLRPLIASPAPNPQAYDNTLLSNFPFTAKVRVDEKGCGYSGQNCC